MANSLINGTAPGATPAPAAEDTSVWMYRDGEAKLFASLSEVPDGWSDSPAKPAPKAKKEKEAKEEANGDG